MTRSRESEKDFQQKVTDLAALCGWAHFHVFDSRRSNPGFPDLILVKPPRLIAAELKSEKGRLTQKQAEWLALLGASGVETYVWKPSDFDVVASVLGEGRVKVG